MAMSRIRSIHPGIWTDEAFMSASAHARLLLIGVWTEAWDDGVFEWKALTLKARIFPVDSVDVAALLDELATLLFVQRFQANGKEYGAIRNFQKYQRPKKPNSSGVLPNSLCSWVGVSEPVPNQYGTSGEKSPQMEDVGGRMKEKEDASASSARAGSEVSDLRKAIVDAFTASGSISIPDTSRASIWLERGWKPSICIAVIGEILARKPSVSSLNYFERAIADAHVAPQGQARPQNGYGPKPIVVSMTPEERATALANTGRKWVEYDTPEWGPAADRYKAENGKYPPHPQGGWYFPASYFQTAGAAA